MFTDSCFFNLITEHSCQSRFGLFVKAGVQTLIQCVPTFTCWRMHSAAGRYSGLLVPSTLLTSAITSSLPLLSLPLWSACPFSFPLTYFSLHLSVPPHSFSSECHPSTSIIPPSLHVNCLSLSASPSVHTGAMRLEAQSFFWHNTPPFSLPVFSLCLSHCIPPSFPGMGWRWGCFKSCGGRKVVSHQSSTHWQTNPATATPQTHSCINMRIGWRGVMGEQIAAVLKWFLPCLPHLPPTLFSPHFHHYD